jgi:hypothetical protein
MSLNNPGLCLSPNDHAISSRRREQECPTMFLKIKGKRQHCDTRKSAAVGIAPLHGRRPPPIHLADLCCTKKACTKRFGFLSSFIRHLENSSCSGPASQADLRLDVIGAMVLAYLASSTVSFQDWLSQTPCDHISGFPRSGCPLCQSRRFPQQPLSRARATAGFASLSGLVQHLETHPATFERDLGLCKVVNFLEDVILGEELPGRLLLLGPSRWSIWN